MDPRPPDLWADRIRPFVAGLSSAAVVMLAFLVPSIQDLWDRHESRLAVDRYEHIGRALLGSEKYTAAEEAFDRALELGGNQRSDLLELKLRARVLRIREDPEWAGKVPEDLRESDFLYLIELEKARGKVPERAVAYVAYALLLVNQKRWREAEENLRDAIALDPKSADAYTALGNVHADRGRTADAEAAYRQALSIDPNDASARYDLGLLLHDSGRGALAIAEFERYVAIHPDEPLGRLRLAEVLADQNRTEAARAAFSEILRLDPANAEARGGLARLPARSP